MSPISHATTKNVFTEDVFNAIVTYHEEQSASQLDLHSVLLIDYIISVEPNRVHYEINSFMSSIQNYR